MIHKIFKKDNVIYLKVSDYRDKRSIYSKPCDSKMLDTFEIDDVVIPGSERNIQLNTIQCKMVKFTFNFSKDEESKTFMVPMLH